MAEVVCEQLNQIKPEEKINQVIKEQKELYVLFLTAEFNY